MLYASALARDVLDVETMAYRDGASSPWARIDALERERARLKVKLERLSQRRRRQARRRAAIWMSTLVAATSITLGFAAVEQCTSTRCCCGSSRDSAKISANALRAVAEVWRVSHANDCPTVAGLIRPEELARSSDPHDPWGQPFVITCDGDGVSVTSSGPDRVLDTADDVRSPRE